MTMLTPEQLNAIRQRVEKAKAGRWVSLRTNTLGSSIYDIVTEDKNKGVCVTYHLGTADFITHSISDIPALLDEVESLQGALRIMTETQCALKARVEALTNTIMDLVPMGYAGATVEEKLRNYIEDLRRRASEPYQTREFEVLVQDKSKAYQIAASARRAEEKALARVAELEAENEALKAELEEEK